MKCILLLLTSLLCSTALADPNIPESFLPDTTKTFKLKDSDFIISVMSIPWLKFYADKDAEEINEGIEFDSNLNTGSGYAIHIGLGHADTTEDWGDILSCLGVTYMTSRHTETETVQRARMDALFLEGSIKRGLFDRLYMNLGAGVGGIVFDLPEGKKSADGIAGLLRVDLGVELVEHVMVQAGAGWFRWGHPGETYGNGAFLELGGVWQF